MSVGYIARRLGLFLIVIWVAGTFNFMLPRLGGQNPIREKLVNMAKHNYVTADGGVEPNSFLTPDKKWVVFKSNMFGPQHVFAVEIAKTKL